MANKNYENIDDYLKDTTGKDSSGMSAQEKQIAETDLSAYKQKNLLQQTYDNAIGELDAQKKAQEKQSYFNNAKLMKYLPQNLKAQGLNGLGISQTAQIEANNNYMNQLANISSDYNSNKTTLSNDLAKNQLAVEETARQEKNALNQYWQNRQDAIDAEQRGYDYQDKVRNEDYAYQDKVRQEGYDRDDKLIAEDRAYQDKVRNEGYAHDITMQDKANEFTSSENEKDRIFTAGQNQLNRDFEAEENAKQIEAEKALKQLGIDAEKELLKMNQAWEETQNKIAMEYQDSKDEQAKAEALSDEWLGNLQQYASTLLGYLDVDSNGNYDKSAVEKIRASLAPYLEYLDDNDKEAFEADFKVATLDGQKQKN